jgi:hypothetical protein
MRKHGVSNPEYREYAMGAKRYNIERELLEKQQEKVNKGVLHFRFVEREWNKGGKTRKYGKSAVIYDWINAIIRSIRFIVGLG